MCNRLAGQTSPYLLQHADNPVDWYPWGEEAFDRARAEDKPVFLSIGYSSCHWCHVMAHESFEDEEVAALMNHAFINVKVDREELPHIDHVYMQACQIMTGSGGWPLTVIMTPDGKPFFAATYLPRNSRHGLTGMKELIPVIERLWIEKRGRVVEEADEIVRIVQRATAIRPGDHLNPDLVSQACAELKERHDAELGGFGDAPKFPMPHALMFLLRCSRQAGDPEALSMVVKTLDAMQRGGIYDHVGYGFHRYSTDRKWLVPHFEKMLYDQALLAMAYAETFQVTGRKDFRKTAEDTVTYVLEDLATEDGLFSSARDADSEGEEGRFYLWTMNGIGAVLDEDDTALAREAFGLREEGNAPGMGKGMNIIHLAQGPDALARKLGLDVDTLTARLAHILGRLRQARSLRNHPLKDTKALTDWNGLMIAALARCGTVLSRPDHIAAAKRAADFILDRTTVDGRLGHIFMAGEFRFDAGLDDHAYLTWGLIELYEATFERRYLDEAVRLSSDLMEHFWDGSGGGFFSTSHDTETTLVRIRSAYDNAVPSGNSVAMLNLLRLADLTGDGSLRERAVDIGKAFSSQVKRAPSAFVFMLGALGYLNGPSASVVIAGDPEGDDTREMVDAFRGRFLPHAVIRLDPAEPGRHPSTARVCTGSICHEPTMEVEKMLEHLA